MVDAGVIASECAYTDNSDGDGIWGGQWDSEIDFRLKISDFRLHNDAAPGPSFLNLQSKISNLQSGFRICDLKSQILLHSDFFLLHSLLLRFLQQCDLTAVIRRMLHCSGQHET